MLHKKLVVVTHDGIYHADDVVAGAILKIMSSLMNLEFSVIRSRKSYDSSEDGEMVFCVDVGGVYDPTKGLFDHHQAYFAEVRPNGQPFASAGLVWKKFGSEVVFGLCHTNDYFPNDKIVQNVHNQIDNTLISAIDGRDVGRKTHQGVGGYNPFTISDMVTAYSRSNKPMEECVDIVSKLIESLIYVVHNDELSKEVVENLLSGQEGNEVVVLNSASFLPWQEVIFRKSPSTLFVVYYDGKEWKLQAAAKQLGSFETKALLPNGWRGLSGEELQALSGYTSATFCHRGGWIAGFVSRDDAVRAAHEALFVHHTT